MHGLQDLAIFGAGLAAGSINAVMGSGSLITFPTLLAFGYPALLANMSNTVGLVPGSVSGAIGYRRELAGMKPYLIKLGLAGIAGGITGSIVLFVLPGHVFRRVVPVLIIFACALLAAQPWLSRHLEDRRSSGKVNRGRGVTTGIYLTGIYGGYFGAAQGVLLVAILATFLPIGIQQANAIKNVLAALVNGVAALLFIAFGHIAWEVSALLAVGSIIGGQVGSIYGRKIPPGVLRFVIVIGGTAVGIALL
ncbi:MAG: sulfite exporter TauE/SafE family protein [Acidimicrobiales bacterium]